MDETPICPKCHVAVKTTDYFCYNCGTNVHPKPLSTSVTTQLLIYIGSITLPPLGLFWGFKYLRQPDQGSKIVGIVAIILTIIILVLTVIFTVNLVNTINTQVNQQLQNVQF